MVKLLIGGRVGASLRGVMYTGMSTKVEGEFKEKRMSRGAFEGMLLEAFVVRVTLVENKACHTLAVWDSNRVKVVPHVEVVRVSNVRLSPGAQFETIDTLAPIRVGLTESTPAVGHTRMGALPSFTDANTVGEYELVDKGIPRVSYNRTM